jgi:hypothetical protein
VERWDGAGFLIGALCRIEKEPDFSGRTLTGIAREWRQGPLWLGLLKRETTASLDVEAGRRRSKAQELS